MSKTAYILCLLSVAFVTLIVIAMYTSYTMQLQPPPETSVVVPEYEAAATKAPPPPIYPLNEICFKARPAIKRENRT